jgi:hypothetical protein
LLIGHNPWPKQRMRSIRRLWLLGSPFAFHNVPDRDLVTCICTTNAWRSHARESLVGSLPHYSIVNERAIRAANPNEPPSVLQYTEGAAQNARLARSAPGQRANFKGFQTISFCARAARNSCLRSLGDRIPDIAPAWRGGVADYTAYFGK